MVNHYRYGQPWNQGLYSVNGDAADWMYNNKSVFAVSPEVAPKDPVKSDLIGFWPPKKDVITNAKEDLHMNYRGAWAAGTIFGFVGTSKQNMKIMVNQAYFSLSANVQNEGFWHSNGDVRIMFAIDGLESALFKIENIGVLKAKSANVKVLNFKVLLPKTFRRFLLSSRKNEEMMITTTAMSEKIGGKKIYIFLADDIHCEMYGTIIPTLNRWVNDSTSNTITFSIGDEALSRHSSQSNICKQFFSGKGIVMNGFVNNNSSKTTAEPCRRFGNHTRGSHTLACKETFSTGEIWIGLVILILSLVLAFGYMIYRFRGRENRYWEEAKRFVEGTSGRGGKGFIKLGQTEIDATTNAEMIFFKPDPIINQPTDNAKAISRVFDSDLLDEEDNGEVEIDFETRGTRR